MRVINLAHLPPKQTLGFPYAVLFGMPLSKEFLRDLYAGRPTLREEYLEKEQLIEALADQAAKYLAQRGCRAHSQSERSNLANGLKERGYIDPAIETGPSVLPQKTLGRPSGLGFIGNNNLLVTREYGCAIVLCSVLTDAPLEPHRAAELENRCGSCRACVQNCVSGALTGRSWSASGGRAALLDISRCCCPLKCMVVCPWTMRYAGIPDNSQVF